MPIFFLSIVLSLCSVLWVYPYHFALPYFETDFVDYCVGVEMWNDWSRYFPPKRSRLVSLVAGVYHTWFGMGILESLFWASVTSVVGVAWGILFWLRSVSGVTGWIALGVLSAFSPWFGMGRMLTFYPEIVLCLVWGGALVAQYLYQKDISSTKRYLYSVGAGVGVALAMLCDARGLIWGTMYMVVVYAMVFWRYKDSLQKKGHGWTLYMEGIFVTLPIVCSWFLGQWVYHPHSSSLMRQLDMRPLQYALEMQGAPAPPYTLPTEFMWGYGSISSAWANVQFILSQQSLSLPNTTMQYSLYWWTILIGCILSIAIVMVWKRQHSLLLLPLLPFFVAFINIGSSVEEHVRFYMQCIPIFVIAPSVALTMTLEKKWKEWKIFYKISLVAVMLMFPLWIVTFTAPRFSPHWSIEREISNKMLQQTFPDHPILRGLNKRFGNTVHIQTLPITEMEKQIAHDWDHVCTEALSPSDPMLFGLW